ncbi:DNA-deoxyinosine glycosylase [Burkholderia sp. FERM BP-3421]|uniref:DNA-deoxyinosine glycosylase n=1 Tax=Burkholderia sp. FERM BP-3421 TaxID=1494466 RepID=UPI00236007BB|nr:DNA-deoxyinosine glycosylase [Burkholderia sp. FERM BP-3421]WDD94827.1 DNA-deoxyinosine glycosylase [Burkholderia sp. FERM BP-3421]
MTFKRCFPPVVDARTRVLILGSLPGERSLAHGQYYAHPQNKFWLLVGAVIGCDLVALAYPARLDALREHRIGLWDVVAEARRAGSLDSNLRDLASNDLIALIGTLPDLAAIAFNGGTAAKVGTKTLGEAAQRYQLLGLPSSSPAHASVPYAAKLDAWRALQRYAGR